ncbi:hypothetical protein SY94_5388 (plasmid) [Agrobacterium tumefaciens]|nr:hypothetical protein SY94_5388 [Agrobacterium tumefaciens]
MLARLLAMAHNIDCLSAVDRPTSSAEDPVSSRLILVLQLPG